MQKSCLIWIKQDIHLRILAVTNVLLIDMHDLETMEPQTS